MCNEFELTASRGAKDHQASKLGVYQKHLTIVNKRSSYFNEDKNQYLFWITKTNEPGYWTVKLIFTSSR